MEGFFTFYFDVKTLSVGSISSEPFLLLPIFCRCCAFKLKLFIYSLASESCTDSINKEWKDCHPLSVAICRQEAKFIWAESVAELGRKAETSRSQPNAVISGPSFFPNNVLELKKERK